jgi:methylated-DNA-[protein]-cysteine S-methyltransferase
MKLTDSHRDIIISSVKREYFLKYRDFRKAKQLLRRYLRGERVSFCMRLNLNSLSPFTQRVLAATRSIPYGCTKNYAWVAKKLALPGGSRSIGQALKRNPLPVIIPCHRVIKSNGEIGGFSKGVVVKKKLLDMEKKCLLNF